MKNCPSTLDVPWEVFSFVEHRIDSSSCHIYTALWTNLPVVIKLIKAERVQSAVAVSEFEAEAAVLSSVSPHYYYYLLSLFLFSFHPLVFLSLCLSTAD